MTESTENNLREKVKEQLEKATFLLTSQRATELVCTQALGFLDECKKVGTEDEDALAPRVTAMMAGAMDGFADFYPTLVGWFKQTAIESGMKEEDVQRVAMAAKAGLINYLRVSFEAQLLTEDQVLEIVKKEVEKQKSKK